ncbi:MAG: hypothetical protein EDS66_17050 [Planctomycetota bacterium]|nr:MAG: hypothetical protein EDS66_17050 [Planctomycetota bacterium]MCQ3922207.1 hypothetical protein [Planctomycetota bacterium]
MGAENLGHMKRAARHSGGSWAVVTLVIVLAGMYFGHDLLEEHLAAHSHAIYEAHSDASPHIQHSDPAGLHAEQDVHGEHATHGDRAAHGEHDAAAAHSAHLNAAHGDAHDGAAPDHPHAAAPSHAAHGVHNAAGAPRGDPHNAAHTPHDGSAPNHPHDDVRQKTRGQGHDADGAEESHRNHNPHSGHEGLSADGPVTGCTTPQPWEMPEDRTPMLENAALVRRDLWRDVNGARTAWPYPTDRRAWIHLAGRKMSLHPWYFCAVGTYVGVLR